MLAACLLPGLWAAQSLANAPQRVVSLDYCADQYVMQFVSHERIIGVSPDADSRFSYLAKRAVGLPVVRPVAEDVLIAQPDLVVRSYGGGPKARAFFEHAGIPVLQVGYVNTLAEMRAVTLAMAEGLGAADQGQALVRSIDTRLQKLQANADSRSQRTLYMTPSGFTSGPGTLMHEMLTAANLENYQTQPGWHSLPLEQLVYQAPERLVLSFFDSHNNQQNLWSGARHPVMLELLQDQPKTALPGAWTACGGWFLMDAIERLAQ